MAWLIYLISALALVLAVGWRVRRANNDKRWGVMGTLLVVLGMPWTVDAAGTAWAPAFIIMAFEGLTQGMAALSRAGIPLFSALGVLYLILLGNVLCRRLWNSDK